MVLVTGVLKPAVQVNVGAQVNGQLRKLYVRQGEKVQKGQLLAEIDPTLQESDLNNTRAQLASAKAQKLSAQATLLRYRQELNRQSMMLRDGSGVRSEYEQARAQYDAQVQQIDVSDAQIVQAEMAVKTAQANLSYTRIVAPIDGEVLGIVTREGQTIVSSQTAPTILVLADLDTMQVQTRISEADVQKSVPVSRCVSTSSPTRINATPVRWASCSLRHRKRWKRPATAEWAVINRRWRCTTPAPLKCLTPGASSKRR